MDAADYSSTSETTRAASPIPLMIRMFTRALQLQVKELEFESTLASYRSIAHKKFPSQTIPVK